MLAAQATAPTRSRRAADEIPREQRSRIKRAREGLIEDGVPVETYRRIGLDEALARLV